MKVCHPANYKGRCKCWISRKVRTVSWANARSCSSRRWTPMFRVYSSSPTGESINTEPSSDFETGKPANTCTWTPPSPKQQQQQEQQQRYNQEMKHLSHTTTQRRSGPGPTLLMCVFSSLISASNSFSCPEQSTFSFISCSRCWWSCRPWEIRPKFISCTKKPSGLQQLRTKQQKPLS